MDIAWRALDPGARRLWRRMALVVVVVVSLPGLVAAALRSGPPGAAATGAVTALLLSFVVRLVDRRWRAWGYAEREADLLIRRGIIVRRLSVVPYGRMQYVDVTQGPFERAFGLATVQLHTASAASDAAIPGLAEPEAHRLRDRLAELGEARAAGL